MTPARRALALLLLACAPAWAAAPVAKLAGPAKAEPRGQVLLDPAGTVGDDEPDLELARGPAPATIVPLYGKDGRLVFGLASPPEPGTYLFVLVARGTPEGSGRAVRAYAFHEVVVGAPPGPTPTPPPDDRPRPPQPAPATFAAFVTAEALKVDQPPAHRAQVAAVLAASYRAIAAQAGAGIYADPGALLAANREAVRQCLGSNLPAWQPFFLALKARLELDAPGTVPALKDAWVQIAAGLEGVR